MKPRGSLPATTSLRGRWLLIVRMAWVAVAVLGVGLFIAALPVNFERLTTVCTSGAAACADRSQITPNGVRVLRDLGLSLDFYAAYVLALPTVLAAVWCAVGTFIFWRKSDDRMALFAAFTLVTFGVGDPSFLDLLKTIGFVWWLLGAALVYVGQVSFLAFFYLFPDGRFVPRWTRWLAAAWGVLWVPTSFFPDSPLNVFDIPSMTGAVLPLGSTVIFLGFVGSAVVAQVYRYRRVSGPVERQQTKWVVFGFTATIVGVSGALLPFAVIPSFARPGLLGEMAINTVVYSSALLIPLSIGFAVLRYRLWDVDVLMNRTLVYGMLTIGVVGLYVLAVGSLGVLLQARGNLLISLLATGLVAVLFAPLRNRLQRGINRLMYGERDEPYAVLSRLGRRLEGTLSPEAVLPAIVENVARALRLPHAEIWLADGDALRLGAAQGSAPSETTVRDADAGEKLRRAPDGLRPADLGPSSPYAAVLAQSGAALVLPLTHRGELVGALCVAPRGPDEDFSPADRRLLRDLATQAGAAAHAVRLTVTLRSSLEDLRRSRERLVAAQDEERRRIQRDLHDGLGPVLASMRLRLEACLDATQETGDPLAGDLERLYELVGQATGDIRRLVYDLRPPVLDQLGLVPALRQHCERFSRESGVEVRFEAEEGLPIPAAAEVALLRVAQEALHNVGKHARASRADVRLARSDGWLELEVQDDGAGFGTNGHTPVGTGIGSMRERAELLGGTLRVDSRTGAGTRVTVRIPAEGAAR